MLCTTLQSKKHRFIETSAEDSCSSRRLLCFPPPRRGGWCSARRSPQAEVRSVRTDWHLVVVIFLVLHVSLGESFLRQMTPMSCQEPKEQPQHNQNPLPSQEAKRRGLVLLCLRLHRPDRRAIAGPGASQSPVDAASHGP